MKSNIFKTTSCQKLKEYMKEEFASSKNYMKRGFIPQAIDERRHAEFFKGMYKKCGKR